MEVEYRHIGVATAVIRLNGFSFITDPCLGPSGTWHHHGMTAFSRKTADPRVPVADLPDDLDFALVSHGHHSDNLDSAGRGYLESVPRTLTTTYSAPSIPRATGLDPGESCTITTDGGPLRVHAVTAQHGIYPLSILAGPVNGYVLEIEDPNMTLYVSGDTIFTEEIADELHPYGDINLFIPHLGNAKFPLMSGPLRYSMNRRDLIRFLDVLNPDYTLPIHNEGWSHFNPVDLSETNDLNRRTDLLLDPEGSITLS